MTSVLSAYLVLLPHTLAQLDIQGTPSPSAWIGGSNEQIYLAC